MAKSAAARYTVHGALVFGARRRRSAGRFSLSVSGALVLPSRIRHGEKLYEAAALADVKVAKRPGGRLEVPLSTALRSLGYRPLVRARGSVDESER